MDKSTQETSWGTIGLVCLFIIIGFFLTVFDRTAPLQEKVNTNQSTVNQSLSSNQFAAYDNKDLKGTDVLSCIRTNASSGVSVIVQTRKNTSGKKYNTSSYNITDTEDPNYIEPTVYFKASIGRTDNGTVNSITFVQE